MIHIYFLDSQWFNCDFEMWIYYISVFKLNKVLMDSKKYIHEQTLKMDLNIPGLFFSPVCLWKEEITLKGGLLVYGLQNALSLIVEIIKLA